MCTINIIIEEVKKRGFTQKEFAEKIEIKKQVISDWKSGRNNSYFTMIPQIAKLLDVSADYLLGLSNTPKIKGQELSEKELKLIEDYQSLNEQGQEYIRQTMYNATVVYKKCESISSMENA